MTPDEPSTELQPEPAPEAPTVAAPARVVRLKAKPAPARAVRLKAKPTPLPVARRSPLPAVSSYSQAAPLPAREPRSTLERKLAGMHDATDMLRVLDTEVALQRALRLHGGGSRQTLRVAAIALFFTLLIAALGGMFYLQGKMAERGFSRHRNAHPTASPAPVPSVPTSARTLQSADSAR